MASGEEVRESGVQPSATDESGDRALHSGNIEIREDEGLSTVEEAGESGEQRSATDESGDRALHSVNIEIREDEGLSTVEEAGASGEQRSAIDAERGYRASHSGNVESIQDEGFANAEDEITLLLNAAKDGDVQKVRLLVDRRGVHPSVIAVRKGSYLSLYLRECSRMGIVDLVERLVDEGADPFEGDHEGKTALHYAAEGANDSVIIKIIETLLEDHKKQTSTLNVEKVGARDKYGRTVLHFAAFLGHKNLCPWLVQVNRNLIDVKDTDGQSAIFYAVAGPHDNPAVLDEFITSEEARNQIFVEDFSQRTPLHVAAARGNLNMVEMLLQVISQVSGEDRKIYFEAPDVHGQTALHKAASGGHVKVVKMLLDNGVDHAVRDYDGRTAIHFAAEADGEDAVKKAELLLIRSSDEQKSLLLFASAGGISLPSNPALEKYIEENKEIRGSEDLLRIAARLGDMDMTRELITRGADIYNLDWLADLPKSEARTAQLVLQGAAFFVELEADKPALQDTLGRSPFAIGLAALFLNPLVKSPINVGIIGEWGMGKSSVMAQTEIFLLKTAAKLAFTNSLKNVGGDESKLSVIGKARRKEIANAIERLDAKRRDASTQEKNFTTKVTRKFWSGLRALWEKSTPFNLNEFLGKKYQLENHEILKSLAVIDKCPMFVKEEKSGSGHQTIHERPLEEESSQGKETNLTEGRVLEWEKMSREEESLQRTIPSILTVRYNAWHYRNETQAWAGLAVEISKELEAVMTVAHKLRTSWMYNWTNRRNNICLKVILPFFLAVVVAIFLSIIAWLVFDTTHNKDIKILKYGGVPVSIIVAAWGLGKSVVSFVKPISSQIESYINLPNHSQNLGYHNKVISDIKFLIKQLSYRPSWLWQMFAFIWGYITFSQNENYVPGTKIPKMPPACSDNLRIIVFVDDLDRCEENVILQVLSAVHLVLATCEINVIMSMENSIIQRAIIRKYGNIKSKDNKSNKDLADKYLRKIVQLPLHLADPSDKNSTYFLQRQLGERHRRKTSTDPAAETKKSTGYNRRKPNRKYLIGPNQDTTRQGLEQTGELEITEESEASQFAAPHIEINVTPEGSEVKERKTKIKGQQIEIDEEDQIVSSIIGELLVAQYSRGEKNAFSFLFSKSARCKKLPRERKCLMAYHRLAWTILFLTFKLQYINPIEGWQVQLITWIFICWEWRHLMTTLIKNWNNLRVLRNWEITEDLSGPSLREIVEDYIDERWPAVKKSTTKKEDDATDSLSNLPDTGGDDHLNQILEEQRKMREDLTKVQEDVRNMMKMMKKVFKEEEDNKEQNSLQQSTMVKDNKSIIIKNFFVEEEDEEGEEEYTTADERAEWNKLREALRRYNVSMNGIQAFQSFTFNCDPGFLPWPLPNLP